MQAILTRLDYPGQISQVPGQLLQAKVKLGKRNIDRTWERGAFELRRLAHIHDQRPAARPAKQLRQLFRRDLPALRRAGTVPGAFSDTSLRPGSPASSPPTGAWSSATSLAHDLRAHLVRCKHPRRYSYSTPAARRPHPAVNHRCRTGQRREVPPRVARGGTFKLRRTARMASPLLPAMPPQAAHWNELDQAAGTSAAVQLAPLDATCP